MNSERDRARLRGSRPSCVKECVVDPKILDLVRQDSRFAYEAYEFICDSVGFTQELLNRVPEEEDDPETDYHVSGEELSRGVCDLAIREFGMMAPVVFQQWGISTTNDIGQIVFNLIAAERLSQSERDDPEDFHDLFDIPKMLTEEFELTIGDKPGRGR
jgi:uncharacterized repeat protein (TIGR04138 family)